MKNFSDAFFFPSRIIHTFWVVPAFFLSEVVTSISYGTFPLGVNEPRRVVFAGSFSHTSSRTTCLSSCFEDNHLLHGNVYAWPVSVSSTLTYSRCQEPLMKASSCHIRSLVNSPRLKRFSNVKTSSWLRSNLFEWVEEFFNSNSPLSPFWPNDYKWRYTDHESFYAPEIAMKTLESLDAPPISLVFVVTR